MAWLSINPLWAQAVDEIQGHGWGHAQERATAAGAAEVDRWGSDGRAGIVLGMYDVGLIESDHWSSRQLENSAGQVRWANQISNIGSMYTIIPVAAGFYGFGVLKNDSKARETGVLGAEAMIDALVVSEALKFAAGRTRPDSTGEKGSFFDAGSSFPSGHAITSWALASVIAHEYSHHKIVPILAYGLATVVSTARFAAQKHYASDIVVGGAMNSGKTTLIRALASAIPPRERFNGRCQTILQKVSQAASSSS